MGFLVGIIATKVGGEEEVGGGEGVGYLVDGCGEGEGCED